MCCMAGTACCLPDFSDSEIGSLDGALHEQPNCTCSSQAYLATTTIRKTF